jgi:hypothetical protein
MQSHCWCDVPKLGILCCPDSKERCHLPHQPAGSGIRPEAPTGQHQHSYGSRGSLPTGCLNGNHPVCWWCGRNPLPHFTHPHRSRRQQRRRLPLPSRLFRQARQTRQEDAPGACRQSLCDRPQAAGRQGLHHLGDLSSGGFRPPFFWSSRVTAISAAVGSGRPSACHGCAVACIGQPPPPSAPGPVWGWRAGQLSRGCGGRAFARINGAEVGPRPPRAAARLAGHSGLNLAGLLISCRSLRAWPGFA